MGRQLDATRHRRDRRRAQEDPAPETVRAASRPDASLPLFWPWLVAASASEAVASALGDVARRLVFDGHDRPGASEPGWETPHQVTLELQTMQLRDFSNGEGGMATLICAPYALHGSSVADFSPGYSLVETLRACGIRRLAVTDWRSATPDMRFLPIDAYLADLNVAVDDIGPPVDLIGLCQGGWLALVYAARFPGKVRRLVLAGAPVDVSAAPSAVSQLADHVPLERFEDLVRLGDGRIIGDRVLDLWGSVLDADKADRVLQLPAALGASRRRELERRFQLWYGWTVDLPGTYYLQIVSRLFKQNQIARGCFVALGRALDLDDMRAPVFLLAARDDEWVAPPQLLAVAGLVGTPKPAIATLTEPCGHLSLFMGATTLRRAWPRIAGWLACDVALAQAS
jgi:poly(3-hydroxybutyrate) depolymerase